MKDEFYIDKVKKCEVKDLLNTFHYLKDESKDFKVSPYSYGLFRSSTTDILHIGGCLGVCIFTGLPVPEIAVGAFGLQRNEQEGLYELSRLCIHPDVKKEEYGRAVRINEKLYKVIYKQDYITPILKNKKEFEIGMPWLNQSYTLSKGAIIYKL